MTTKQEITLVLFAQNYSLPTIAKKQGVSLSTIRERIRSLSKHYPIEFGNALDLRNVYKRNKKALKNIPPIRETEESGEDNENIKEIF